MPGNSILLVEDNSDDELLTLRALRKGNVQNNVIVAHDGVEALDFLLGRGAHAGRDTSVQPQLILLDLKLPRLDGLEVLRQMRADPRTQTVPVVVLTTSNENSDIHQSYMLGANSFIRKPVDLKHFIDVVEQLGLYWLVLNEKPPRQ